MDWSPILEVACEAVKAVSRERKGGFGRTLTCESARRAGKMPGEAILAG